MVSATYCEMKFLLCQLIVGVALVANPTPQPVLRHLPGTRTAAFAPRFFPGNPRGVFWFSPDCTSHARSDTVLSMDSNIQWWDSDWFKEWERLALHSN